MSTHTKSTFKANVINIDGHRYYVSEGRDEEGKRYFAISHICGAIGISPHTQVNLTKESEYDVKQIQVELEDGRHRQMWCILDTHMPHWMSNIRIASSSPQAQERLEVMKKHLIEMLGMQFMSSKADGIMALIYDAAGQVDAYCSPLDRLPRDIQDPALFLEHVYMAAGLTQGQIQWARTMVGSLVHHYGRTHQSIVDELLTELQDSETQKKFGIRLVNTLKLMSGEGGLQLVPPTPES